MSLAYELLTATGKDLDDVGEIYRVRRAHAESDADYRQRLIMFVSKAITETGKQEIRKLHHRLSINTDGLEPGDC